TFCCRRYVMAVTNLQTQVLRVVGTACVIGAGRGGKTAAYRQPRAFLSLPSRRRALRIGGWRTRVPMPNRRAADERLDHEAASAARTGRSAGSGSALPRQSRSHASSVESTPSVGTAV